jgi:ubiquinone/menaquinone biosynthesis C-methylase UbiE
MLNRAKINASKQGITLTTYVADWRELPSKINGEFDAIVCTGNSFYHLDNNEDKLKVLKNFYRLLKKGGI